MSRKKKTWRPHDADHGRFREVLWRSFSESDQSFIDLFRVGYAIGLLSFIALSVYAAIRGAAFDPVGWGTGFGAILFGGGLGVGLRGRFEDGTGHSPSYPYSSPYSSPYPSSHPQPQQQPGYSNPYAQHPNPYGPPGVQTQIPDAPPFDPANPNPGEAE